MKGILNEIVKERKRQDQKWGEQNHEPVEWMSVLIEEVGEAGKAVLEDRLKHNTNGLHNYREELIQIAAVTIAMIESYDRNKNS